MFREDRSPVGRRSNKDSQRFALIPGWRDVSVRSSICIRSAAWESSRSDLHEQRRHPAGEGFTLRTEQVRLHFQRAGDRQDEAAPVGLSQAAA